MSWLWEVINFPKFLQHLSRQIPDFQNLLAVLYNDRPCTPEEPYHLVTYCDETVPGVLVRLDNKRKVMCVYVTIREFGPLLLRKECLWFPLAVIQTNEIKKVVGGWTSAFRIFLRHGC